MYKICFIYLPIKNFELTNESLKAEAAHEKELLARSRTEETYK